MARAGFTSTRLASLLADANARTDEYLLSRAVASMLMRDSAIDGFFFPSVRDPLGGINIALKPEAFDKKMHATCCMHGRVGNVREFGFVDFVVDYDVEQQLDEGALLWLDCSKKGHRRFFHLSKEERDAAAAAGSDAFIAAMSAYKGTRR